MLYGDPVIHRAPPPPGAGIPVPIPWPSYQECRRAAWERRQAEFELDAFLRGEPYTYQSMPENIEMRTDGTIAFPPRGGSGVRDEGK